MNIRQDACFRDGTELEQFGELLVASNSQLEMTRSDSRLSVITGGVSGQFEDFCREIFEDGGEVDRSTLIDSIGNIGFFESLEDASDGELEAGSH